MSSSELRDSPSSDIYQLAAPLGGRECQLSVGSNRRLGMKSLTFDVVFRNGDRNVARGSMKTVCCIVRPGQGLESMEIPDEYRSRFEEHPEEQTGT